MGGKKRPGREFEEAVYAFVNTLDPSAEVIYDHRVLDRDSGQLLPHRDALFIAFWRD